MIKYNANFLKAYNARSSVRAFKWLTGDALQKVKLRQKEWYATLLQSPKDSFLLGKLPKGTDAEVHMYLTLSSLRNYFDYIESKKTTLPLILALDKYSKLQILTNRLLKVIDEEIYFIYEG